MRFTFKYQIIKKLYHEQKNQTDDHLSELVFLSLKGFRAAPFEKIIGD